MAITAQKHLQEDILFGFAVSINELPATLKERNTDGRE
jgi:hypothetical protein